MLCIMHKVRSSWLLMGRREEAALHDEGLHYSMQASVLDRASFTEIIHLQSNIQDVVEAIWPPIFICIIF